MHFCWHIWGTLVIPSHMCMLYCVSAFNIKNVFAVNNMEMAKVSAIKLLTTTN